MSNSNTNRGTARKSTGGPPSKFFLENQRKKVKKLSKFGPKTIELFNASLKESKDQNASESVREGPEIKCGICAMLFTREYDLRRHIERIHEKIRDHKCEKCGKAFYKERELEKHARNCEILSHFKCPLCNKTFGGFSYLKKHIQLVHKKMKKYECEKCGDTLFPKELKQHIKDFHETENELWVITQYLQTCWVSPLKLPIFINITRSRHEFINFFRS